MQTGGRLKRVLPAIGNDEDFALIAATVLLRLFSLSVVRPAVSSSSRALHEQGPYRVKPFANESISPFNLSSHRVMLTGSPSAGGGSLPANRHDRRYRAGFFNTSKVDGVGLYFGVAL